MGCCSSKKSNNSLSNSVSPTKAPEPINDKNNQPAHKLRQHHDMNQHTTDEDDDDLSPPHSFANNHSIFREMMRLEECQLDDNSKHHHVMEIKSNENSEDVHVASHHHQDKSVAEFITHAVHIHEPTSPSMNQNEETIPYHPFGLVDEKLEKKNTTQIDDESDDNLVDSEALYAENLKQHGFDPDKFRMANTSMQRSSHLDNGQQNGSEDIISSFVSSELSSKSDIVSKRKKKNQRNDNKTQYDKLDIDAFLADQDDDDLLLEELSRPNSKGYNSVYLDEENADGQMGYIESMKESMRDKPMNDIMDDDDEQLMDAILSLDMED